MNKKVDAIQVYLAYICKLKKTHPQTNVVKDSILLCIYTNIRSPVGILRELNLHSNRIVEIFEFICVLLGYF